MLIIITNVTELQAMENDLTADYELSNNIDASATSGWNSGAGFDPVGSSGSEFTGSFDGKGYTINNLYINRPTERGVGLFGYTDGAGEIKNVGIVNCDITGEKYVGALVGGSETNDTSFTNCYSTGSITAGSSTTTTASVGGLFGYVGAPVEDCYSTCSVNVAGGSGKVLNIGGLIGTLLSGGVTRSYATGDVIVTGDGDIESIGGLIGLDLSSSGSISKCYSTSDISVTAGDEVYAIGGFIGDNSVRPYSDCYARGSVTVVASSPEASSGFIGGFIGLNYPSVNIDNCYSTGLLTITDGVPFVGGFCGGNYGTITNCFWNISTSGMIISDGGTGKATAQMKTRQTFVDAGWSI